MEPSSTYYFYHLGGCEVLSCVPMSRNCSRNRSHASAYPLKLPVATFL